MSFLQWNQKPNISGYWDLNWGWWASHTWNLPTFMGTISRCLQTRQLPTMSWRRSLTWSYFTLSDKEVQMMNGGRLMLLQMKTQRIWWWSPSLQERSVRSLLVCFCTISKIRWFVGGVEVRLHLNHSVRFLIVFDIWRGSRFSPKPQIFWNYDRFHVFLSMGFMKVSHEKEFPCLANLKILFIGEYFVMQILVSHTYDLKFW